MGSGAKASFETFANQGQLAPNTQTQPSWTQSTVNNAISRLNTALARPDNDAAGGPQPNPLPCDVKRYLDGKVHVRQ